MSTFYNLQFKSYYMRQNECTHEFDSTIDRFQTLIVFSRGEYKKRNDDTYYRRIDNVSSIFPDIFLLRLPFFLSNRTVYSFEMISFIFILSLIFFSTMKLYLFFSTF